MSAGGEFLEQLAGTRHVECLILVCYARSRLESVGAKHTGTTRVHTVVRLISTGLVHKRRPLRAA